MKLAVLITTLSSAAAFAPATFKVGSYIDASNSFDLNKYSLVEDINMRIIINDKLSLYNLIWYRLLHFMFCFTSTIRYALNHP